MLNSVFSANSNKISITGLILKILKSDIFSFEIRQWFKCDRPEVGRYNYLFTKNLQIIFLQFAVIHIQDFFLHVAGMRFGYSFC